MRLTNKAKYALKALLYLARDDSGKPVLIGTIASRYRISRGFLATTLLDLRRRGFVTSRKGVGGGYVLSRPADQISVGAVIRSVDGPVRPVPCLEPGTTEPCADCDSLDGCAVRKLMFEVSDAIGDILEHCTLADVIAGGGSTKKLLHYEL